MIAGSSYIAGIFRAGLLVLCLASLASCAAVIGGAAATSAMVATDRRTAGELLDDQTTELRVESEIGAALGEQARVVATSYAGRLLLTGDVPTEVSREQAEAIAKNFPKVISVDNYLRIGQIAPISVRSNDTWITSKVKTQLIATKDVPFRTILVNTERSDVYLLGKLTEAEAARAAIVAASISGVNKVVKLFQIVSPESLQAQSGGASVPAAELAPESQQPSLPENEAQASPVL